MIGNLATSDLRSSLLVEEPGLVDNLVNVLNCDYSSDEMLVKVSNQRNTFTSHLIINV